MLVCEALLTFLTRSLGQTWGKGHRVKWHEQFSNSCYARPGQSYCPSVDSANSVGENDLSTIGHFVFIFSINLTHFCSYPFHLLNLSPRSERHGQGIKGGPDWLPLDPSPPTLQGKQSHLSPYNFNWSPNSSRKLIPDVSHCTELSSRSPGEKEREITQVIYSSWVWPCI